MVSTFIESCFEFVPGDSIPEHVDADPGSVTPEKSTFTIEGRKSDSDEKYPIAVNVQDLATAQLLQHAYKRKLASIQSGEQPRDRISIVYPN